MMPYCCWPALRCCIGKYTIYLPMLCWSALSLNNTEAWRHAMSLRGGGGGGGGGRLGAVYKKLDTLAAEVERERRGFRVYLAAARRAPEYCFIIMILNISILFNVYKH